MESFRVPFELVVPVWPGAVGASYDNAGTGIPVADSQLPGWFADFTDSKYWYALTPLADSQESGLYADFIQNYYVG